MKKKKIFTFSLFLIVAASFFSIVGLLTTIKPTQAEYGDLTLNHYAEKAGMPPVIFPHWFHRIRFKCKVCHPNIFEMKQGSNDITMVKIVKGDFCGKCHNGKIAWPPIYCDRCHSGKSDITIPKARGFLK
jgi:c(7)-type cytochrome triheme protein